MLEREQEEEEGGEEDDEAMWWVGRDAKTKIKDIQRLEALDLKWSCLSNLRGPQRPESRPFRFGGLVGVFSDCL